MDACARVWNRRKVHSGPAMAGPELERYGTKLLQGSARQFFHGSLQVQPVVSLARIQIGRRGVSSQQTETQSTTTIAHTLSAFQTLGDQNATVPEIERRERRGNVQWYAFLFVFLDLVVCF